jgi:hypothetical protein
MASRALPVASTTSLGDTAGGSPRRATLAGGLRTIGGSLVASAALAALAGGCVDPFDGSNLQIDFALAVQTAARPGQTPQPQQPPVHTHYELYAADQVFRTDPDGVPLVDEAGQPILDQTYLFAVTRFEIRPVIDRSSPCFIELEDTEFPGLHVTMYEQAVKARVLAATGFDDPFAPGVPSDVVSDLLGAARRNVNLSKLESDLKAVTSHDPAPYPLVADGCPPADGDKLPAPTCTDDASNARRLAVCRRHWADHPELYEGSDKVFTLPLNGSYLGMVQGTNPINDGRVGGSSMFVDINLVGHDAYVLNWQYDDLDADGSPDFPAELVARERSPVGYVYMAGTPREISRDVTTVPLSNPLEPAIKADLAIVPNLGHDDVHF